MLKMVGHDGAGYERDVRDDIESIGIVDVGMGNKKESDWNKSDNRYRQSQNNDKRESVRKEQERQDRNRDDRNRDDRNRDDRNRDRIAIFIGSQS